MALSFSPYLLSTQHDAIEIHPQAFWTVGSSSPLYHKTLNVRRPPSTYPSRHVLRLTTEHVNFKSSMLPGKIFLLLHFASVAGT